MPTHAVQQLLYDGQKLFCPDHPERPLAHAVSGDGKYRLMCDAAMPGPANTACTKSAEWQSRADMEAELGKLNR